MKQFIRPICFGLLSAALLQTAQAQVGAGGGIGGRRMQGEGINYAPQPEVYAVLLVDPPRPHDSPARSGWAHGPRASRRVGVRPDQAQARRQGPGRLRRARRVEQAVAGGIDLAGAVTGPGVIVSPLHPPSARIAMTSAIPIPTIMNPSFQLP